MTYITVELTKFDKKTEEIISDLDKLIYTMKNLNCPTKPIKFPKFWNEEWIDIAIKEVDKNNMSPEQRLAYEMAISANAIAIKNENKKIEEVKEKENLLVKSNSIKIALQKGKLTIEEIAEYNQTNIDFVLDVQKKISNEVK
jgi:hypothetical protein